jgi:hypothetical protein
MADLAERVDGLEHWRDGNGNPGAAAVLADHEKRIAREEGRNDCQDGKLIEFDKARAVEKATEKQVIIDAFSEAMKKRGKSREGLIRAFGPYAALVGSLLIALLPYLFGK